MQNSLFRSVLGECSKGRKKKSVENRLHEDKISLGMNEKNLQRYLHVCVFVGPSSEAADVARETGQGIKLRFVLVLSWSVKSC